MLRRLLISSLVVLQTLYPVSAAETQFLFRAKAAVITDPVGGSSPPSTPGTPHSIPETSLLALSGNVGGPVVSSVSPRTALSTIAGQIDGGVNGVVYDSATPAVPGLSFSTATGVLSGVPVTPYDGLVSISYHDTSANIGRIALPVEIYPAPALASSQDSYELPRLAQAASYGIGVTPSNSGFYAGVTYSLAPGSAALPHGLSLSDGQIVGSTDVAAETSYEVTIRGTSKAASSVFADKTISINVIAGQEMTLDLLPNSPLVWQLDTSTGTVTERQAFSPAPGPKGSFQGPVSWSLSDAPAWLGIGNDGQFTGTPPSFGSYDATVQVKDANRTTATDTASVKVVAAGYVFLSPGAQFPTVRVNEAWKTADQTATQQQTAQPYSGSYTYFQDGMPSFATLDTTTGAFSGTSPSAGAAIWHLHVTDEDGRHGAEGLLSGTNYAMDVNALPPLAEAMASSVTGGTLYGSPVSVSWPKPSNLIGKATYKVIGSVPGTLYVKTYDNDDANQAATYTSTDGATTRQNPGESAAETEARLSPDHMVLDTAALTLAGIPSQVGDFSVALSVRDDHADRGYTVNPADPNREADNNATSGTSSFSVGPAAALSLTVTPNAVDTVSFGAAASMTVTASHTAFGIPVAQSGWNVSGTLPDGVSYAINGNSLAFSGVPTSKGKSGDIVVSATDSVGNRQSTTVSFNVVAGFLALNQRGSTQTIAQYTGPDPTLITELHSDTGAVYANGSTWALYSGTLPPGVTGVVSPDTSTLGYTGYATTLGSYPNIVWQVTDANGFQLLTPPVTITVGPRNALALTPGNNSVSYVRTGSVPALTVTASNTPYGLPITAANWSLSGALPSGIAANFADGSVTFTGTTPTTGTYPIVVSATDSLGGTASTAINLTVVPAINFLYFIGQTETIYQYTTQTTVTASTRITASNVAYSGGGTGALVSGTLPPGLSVYAPANGAYVGFTGYPTATGTYSNIVLSLTDPAGNVITTTPFTLTVAPRKALTLATSPSTSRKIMQNFDDAATTVTGTNLAYGGTMSAANTTVTGAVPPGVVTAFGTNGTLTYSGKPTAVGTYASTVTVTDAAGASQSTPVTFTVTATGHSFWRIWDNSTTGNATWAGTVSTTPGKTQSATNKMGWGSYRTSTWYDADYGDVSGYKIGGGFTQGSLGGDGVWGYSNTIDGWQIVKDVSPSGAWWKTYFFSRPVNITSIAIVYSSTWNSQYSAIIHPVIQWSDDQNNWTTAWTATGPRSSTNVNATFSQ